MSLPNIQINALDSKPHRGGNEDTLNELEIPGQA